MILKCGFQCLQAASLFVFAGNPLVLNLMNFLKYGIKRGLRIESCLESYRKNCIIPVSPKSSNNRFASSTR